MISLFLLDHFLFLRISNYCLLYLPVVKRTWPCRKTTRTPFRTDNDKNFSLAATRDTDCVFSPLDAINERPLEHGLDHFL